MGAALEGSPISSDETLLDSELSSLSRDSTSNSRFISGKENRTIFSLDGTRRLLTPTVLEEDWLPLPLLETARCFGMLRYVAEFVSFFELLVLKNEAESAFDLGAFAARGSANEALRIGFGMGDCCGEGLLLSGLLLSGGVTDKVIYR